MSFEQILYKSNDSSLIIPCVFLQVFVFIHWFPWLEKPPTVDRSYRLNNTAKSKIEQCPALVQGILCVAVCWIPGYFDLGVATATEKAS